MREGGTWNRLGHLEAPESTLSTSRATGWEGRVQGVGWGGGVVEKGVGCREFERHPAVQLHFKAHCIRKGRARTKSSVCPIVMLYFMFDFQRSFQIISLLAAAAAESI